ncbi:MAG: glycosyltransferase family 4 protein [Anaerolineae bacterium]|nr:glycosyltransferase family 4 protein [Anaerolineae bacterium]
MDIVVVQETDWLRRGPHQQHHLFERLSLRGHTITVLDYPILRSHWPQEPLIVRREDNPHAARIMNGAQIKLITPGTLSPRLLARPSSVFSHHAALKRLIKDRRPDIIVSYALSTGMPALRLARRYDIPYVLHVIDALHALVPSKIVQPVAHTVERWLFGSAAEVILINAHLRDYAIRMGASPDRARVLRTGVDLERFQPGKPDSAIRAELGLAESDYVLFFMGWLYDFSGLRQVVAALADAPLEVKLLVVGDGDEYEWLCQMRNAGLGDRLVLTGRVPYQRIPELLAASDACLLPFQTVTATEHIVPIKIYEYMAGGKPVIATSLPGVMRDIGEGNGVIYAPAEDHIEMALNVRTRAEQLGRAARAFVEAHCDWEAITTEFEAILAGHVR